MSRRPSLLGAPPAFAVVAGAGVITGATDAPSSIVDSAGLEPAYRRALMPIPTVPSAPDLVSAKAGNGFAYVAWTRPVDEGGQPVSGYTVMSSGGQRATISAADFARLGYVTVTGLANGTAYTFTVTATNASGTGTPSLPSPAATPVATPVARPGAPTKLHVTAGDRTAAVFFSPPADPGGSPVVWYQVTASNGMSATVTGRLVLPGKEGFAVFRGLANGTAYTFTVSAVTAGGTGPTATSPPVTPGPV